MLLSVMSGRQFEEGRRASHDCSSDRYVCMCPVGGPQALLHTHRSRTVRQPLGPRPQTPLRRQEITLAEAIRRAEASEPAFAAARAASQSAALDRSIARAGLLPNARFYGQDIYTQPNGIYSEGDAGEPLAPLPRFVANDSRPREYMAQGIVDETLSLAGPAALRRADAAAAMASAEQEIARRGLVVAVTGMFYASLAADHKLTVAESAQQEAADFTKLTREREQAREAAHADVVKANCRSSSGIAMWKTREWLRKRRAWIWACCCLPILVTAYTLKAPEAAPPLASKEDVERAAAKNNPELKSALASLAVSNADVQAAWGALLPSVGLNVTYGIDANQFAVNGPFESRRRPPAA